MEMCFHGNQLSWGINHPWISLIQISLPCLHSSFYNACPRYLKSRRDLLYSSHRAKVLSRLVPPIAINTATTLGPFGGV